MTIQPQYFGRVDQPLFGCYHAPASNRLLTHGVVFCNPFGHEYMACYRTVRQAAVRFAQAGAPSFRFDFYGSGDSAGESGDGRPSRWLRDIAAAAEALQKQHRAGAIALAGLRLGASLALLSLQHHGVEPSALVLWDPIVRGDAYVDELVALQRERYGRGDDREVLGFPFPEDLRDELKQINLLEIERAAKRVLIIETGEAQHDTRQLAERLTSLGATVEHRAVAGTTIWHEPNKASVPAPVIQSLVTWVRSNL